MKKAQTIAIVVIWLLAMLFCCVAVWQKVPDVKDVVLEVVGIATLPTLLLAAL